MSFKDTKVFKNLKKITYRIYNRIISTPFFQKMEVEPVTEDDFLLTVLPFGHIKGRIPNPPPRKNLAEITRELI